MLSLGLALAFALEVALYLLVCLWLWDRSVAGLPLGTIVVVVVTTFIALRICMVLLEFAVSWLFRSPRDPESRVGVLGGIVVVAGEVMSFLLVLWLLLPLSRRLVAARRGVVTTGARKPIVLVHGYAMNAGVWAPLMGYLSRNGLSNLFTVNLQPRFGDIGEFAQQLAVRVNRVCETTRSTQVILVGHGMGGLVCRAYIERYGGGEKVRKLITIGTPHHGTVMARMAPGVSARQTRPSSPWLAELNSEENYRTGIEHVSIYSLHDNVIVPQNSAEFGKAKNMQIAGHGHFSMLLSRQVGRLVYREIAEA